MLAMKRAFASFAVVPVLVAFVACGAEAPADDKASKPRATASATAPVLVYTTTPVEPADKTGFLKGVRARFDSSAEVDDSEFVRWGKRYCALADGHAVGKGKSVSELLTAEVKDSGWSDLYAGDIASASGNAAIGTLCDQTTAEK